VRRGRGLALVALLAFVAACGPSVAPTGSPAASGAVATDAPVAPTFVPDPKHEVYGFLPYWEIDDGIADHLATTDLTTLALFSVTHRRNGELATNQNGYRSITSERGRRIIEEAHDRGVRVELVYTSFGSTKNERFYSEPASQARWTKELVDLVVELGLDGVNVDVESLPGDRVSEYAAFVGTLRTALRAQLPEARVSVSTQANLRGAGMAAAAAGAGADRVFLMGYDYRWEGSSVGASSPIERADGEAGGLRASLDAYAAVGVPVDRTLLGLPLYGITWPVEGAAMYAPATDDGNEWVPRRNLRVFEAAGFSPTYDPVESVEFYSVQAEDGRWDAVYYDSPRSLTPKLSLADARGLAGVGFWAIGYERGLPGYTELIGTFRAGALIAP
jgi:spore germination protein YaaH